MRQVTLFLGFEQNAATQRVQRARVNGPAMGPLGQGGFQVKFVGFAKGCRQNLPGGEDFSRTNRSMRCTIAVVLPAPATAKTNAGP